MSRSGREFARELAIVILGVMPDVRTQALCHRLETGAPARS
jgi:hypothetical protein